MHITNVKRLKQEVDYILNEERMDSYSFHRIYLRIILIIVYPKSMK